MYRIRGCALAIVVVAGAAAAARAAGPLVEPAWLAEHACDDGVVVLDIRGNARAFERARVPCSVHGPYGASGWLTMRDGIPAMLPPAENLAALIGGLGIGNDDHVVIVGAGGSALAMTSATRVYWTFKAAGHDAVSVLDGGFAAYGAERGLRREEGAAAAPEAKPFTVSLRPELVATAEDVAAAAATGIRLLDNRESAFFVGVSRLGAVARAGTLPGAENVPISWLTAPDGRFKDSRVLARIGEATGIGGEAPLITFCNSGQMASLGWFVAHELLGNASARLYDGSMIEWAGDPARPVEQRIPTN
jgi:thiosulfate/3-mercaptopyruvate sulfurtransferase